MIQHFLAIYLIWIIISFIFPQSLLTFLWSSAQPHVDRESMDRNDSRWIWEVIQLASYLLIQHSFILRIKRYLVEDSPSIGWIAHVATPTKAVLLSLRNVLESTQYLTSHHKWMLSFVFWSSWLSFFRSWCSHC